MVKETWVVYRVAGRIFDEKNLDFSKQIRQIAFRVCLFRKNAILFSRKSLFSYRPCSANDALKLYSDENYRSANNMTSFKVDVYVIVS